MLQTSIELKDQPGIVHPHLLILDEPKQQNLDNASLADGITLIKTIPTAECQVILTTYSEVPGDREKFAADIIYEMTNDTDYLLKLQPKTPQA